MIPQTLTFPVKTAEIPLFLSALSADKETNIVQNTTQPGSQWTIVSHKVHCTATYDSLKELLTVIVTDKPFYVSMGMIRSGLADKIKELEAGGTSNA